MYVTATRDKGANKNSKRNCFRQGAKSLQRVSGVSSPSTPVTAPHPCLVSYPKSALPTMSRSGALSDSEIQSEMNKMVRRSPLPTPLDSR